MAPFDDFTVDENVAAKRRGVYASLQARESPSICLLVAKGNHEDHFSRWEYADGVLIGVELYQLVMEVPASAYAQGKLLYLKVNGEGQYGSLSSSKFGHCVKPIEPEKESSPPSSILLRSEG